MSVQEVINTVKNSYISFGLIGPYTVEDHVKGARQKATLSRWASHGKSLTTPSHSICKEQACNKQQLISAQ